MLPFVFDLLRQSAGCLLWGIIVAAVCVVLIFLAFKSWYKNASVPGVTYIILIVMFFMLAYHCAFIVGETKIINSADDCKEYVAEVVDDCNFDVGELVSEEETYVVLDKLYGRYPILKVFEGSLSDYDYAGSVADMPNKVIDGCVEHVTDMLVKDILWCVGVCVIGGILLMLIMRNGGKRKTTAPTNTYTSSEDVF